MPVPRRHTYWCRFGVAFLLLSAGCAPPTQSWLVVTDQFSATYDACGWDDYREQWFGEEWGTQAEAPTGSSIPAYPSTECVDLVLDDFSVDIEAFLEVDEIDDPYVKALDSGKVSVGYRIGAVLAAARSWMLFDQGYTDDLEAGGLIPAAFVDEIVRAGDESGVGSLGASQYNFATSLFEAVRPGEYDQWSKARFSPDPPTMWVRSPWDAADAVCAGLVMHEARHAYSGQAHVECDDNAELLCDDHLDGAIGFGIAARVLAYDSMEDDNLRSEVRLSVHLAMRQVNPMTDDNGEILPAWEAIYDDTLQ